MLRSIHTRELVSSSGAAERSFGCLSPPISHPSKGDVKSQTLQNTQHTLKPTLGGICLDIYAHGNPMLKTLNNGYLGSRNDEERNQMRYVMRSVQLVSHRIFERTLRSRLRPRACLPERQPKPSSPTFCGSGAWTWPSRTFVVERPGRLKRRGAGV